jgi:hypothetical protein
MSEHQKEDGLLAERIEEAYQANRHVSGSPRLHAELQAPGIRCSRHPDSSPDEGARAFGSKTSSSNDHHT